MFRSYFEVMVLDGAWDRACGPPREAAESWLSSWRRRTLNIVRLSLLVVLLVPCVTNVAVAQQQLIQNGTFQNGGANWSLSGSFRASTTFSCSHGTPAGYAYLSNTDGTGGNNLSGSLYQQFSVPAGTTSAPLRFYYSISTQETSTTQPFDVLNVTIQNSSGGFLETVLVRSNLNGSSASCAPYTEFNSLNLSSYAGQTIRLHFLATTDSSLPTVFRVDSVSVLAVVPPPCTYVINPSSATHGSSSGAYSFGMTAGSGCAWTASDNRSWISATTSGSGNGTVNYTLSTNSGQSERTGTITVGGQTFTVTQQGAPAPTGACCVGGTTCITDLTETSCTTQGGVWQGAGSSSCADCTPPTTGACCIGGVTCVTSITEAACTTQGGVWQGGSTSCTNCSPPAAIGSCCIGGSTCVAGVTQSDCTSQGGVWQGADSTSCDNCAGACPPHIAQCPLDGYGQVSGLVMRLPWSSDDEPLQGFQVSQGYCAVAPGEHRGFEVDFQMPTGTTVVAIAPGWVVQTGDDENDPNGRFVRIQHDPVGGVYYTSWYLHLDEGLVECGARVERGATIGRSGNTGSMTTGAHLHLQVERVTPVSTSPVNCGSSGEGGHPSSVNRVRVRPVPMIGRDAATQTHNICDFQPYHWYKVVAVGGPGEPCDGDVNCDFALDGFDVEVQEKAVGGDTADYCQPNPDFNHDFALDGFDVEAVELVVGGGPCP